MSSPDATTEGAGTPATQTDVPRERVSVWAIPEAQAREDAEYLAETVKSMDLNDDETIRLIQLTLMKASGSLSMWDFEGRMRDLFLTANRRRNGHKPLW